MGIIERKIREKAQKRDLIIQKTKELMIHKGIDAVSMQDISNAMEISKASLYLHFLSKEDIMRTILKDALTILQEYMHASIENKKTGLDRLKAIANAYLSLFQKDQDSFIFAGIMEHLYPGYPLREGPALTDMTVKTVIEDTISETVKMGFQDNSFDPDLNPDQVSHTIIFVAKSLVDKISRIPRNLRHHEQIMNEMKGAFDLLLRGIAHPSCNRSSLFIEFPKKA